MEAAARIGFPREDGDRGTTDYIHTPTGNKVASIQRDFSLIASLHGVGITVCSVPAVMSFLQAQRPKIVLPD